MDATLPLDEIRDLFDLGVPLEASHLPEDELRRAIAERRVLEAVSWSSMGTAETYWRLVEPRDDLRHVRDSSVVSPPGQQAEPTPYADYLDDRDVVGVLWDPFHDDQTRALVSRLSGEQTAAFVAACVAPFAALEEQAATGQRALERAVLLGWLHAAAPIDEARVKACVAAHPKSALAIGVHTLLVDRAAAAAVDAVIASCRRLPRAQARTLEPRLRLGLLRHGLALATGRPAAASAVGEPPEPEDATPPGEDAAERARAADAIVALVRAEVERVDEAWLARFAARAARPRR